MASQYESSFHLMWIEIISNHFKSLARGTTTIRNYLVGGLNPSEKYESQMG